eukprot:GHRR01010630.1.p1 GENE.GHRR01010630.1~~GHRR01010630.1.p1  ORF type:complete len:1312 (+),score=676.34 GHRR01010630.1:1142-5077(+)
MYSYACTPMHAHACKRNNHDAHCFLVLLLQLQEKILEWFKSGNWQEIVAEKRSVLTSMQQVLQSCYALLDSTQVPVNSIIKLLQHILRPYGAEQQMLASSRVGNSSGAPAAVDAPQLAAGTMQLPTAQLHHAAIGELLRLLRPASNAVAATPAAAPVAASAETSPAPQNSGNTDMAPVPLSVEKPWDSLDALAAGAKTPAATAGTGASTARGAAKGRGRARACAAAGPAKKRDRSRKEQFMDVESFWRSCSPEQRLQLLQVPLSPLLEGVKQGTGSEAAEELMEGLVLLREQANTSARYWLCPACDRKFHTASDFSSHLQACHEQLVLLKQPPQQHQVQHGSTAGIAVPLALPAAPAADGAGSAVAAVIQQQVQQPARQPASSYVTCSKCQAEVVGIYFNHIQQHSEQQQQLQPHQLCLKCYRQVAASVGAQKAEQEYQRVSPHSPSLNCSAWSESGSEFISMRDSFSSCEDDESVADGEADEAYCQQDDCPISAVGGSNHQQHRQPKGSPQRQLMATNGQLTSQQQRQLSWLSAAVNKANAAAAEGSQQQGQSAGQAVGQQPHQSTVASVQAAPGMFVFGSNRDNAAQTSSVTQQAPIVARNKGFGTEAFHPGARAADAHAGMDKLSSELIAELEAVHAARKRLLAGQQPSPASTSESEDKPRLALEQRQQQQQPPGAASMGAADVASDAAADIVGASSSGAACASLDSSGGPGPVNTTGVSLRRSSSDAAAAGAASDNGTPTAAGRTWRDWLLPKKLLQWSDGDGEGLDEIHGFHREHGVSSGDPSDEPSTDCAYTDGSHDDLANAATAGIVFQRVSAGASSSSPRQHAQAAGGMAADQQLQQQSSGVSGDQGSSTTPSSPRTPAAKDSRQGAEDNTLPAAANSAAKLKLDGTPAGDALLGLQHLQQQLPQSVPAAAMAAAPAGAAATAGQQQQLGVERPIGDRQLAVDALMRCASGDMLADEVIRCMAQVYAAHKDVADMTLGCLLDFVRRKLILPSHLVQEAYSTAQGSSSEQQQGSNEANAGNGSVQQHLVMAAASLPTDQLSMVRDFLANPEATYPAPEVMHAMLCCLPASDLQMALAYVVRQHEETITQQEQSDSEGESAGQSTVADDDTGCIPLFQLHHLDELSFEQLVERIWPGEFEEGQQGCSAGKAMAAANGAAAVARSSNRGSGSGGISRNRHRHNGAVNCSSNRSDRLDTRAQKPQPMLIPASWWLEHLQQSSNAADPPTAAAADERILRWVFGNILSSQAEEFAAQQAILKGSMDRQAALLELYECIANARRRMQRAADKRYALEQLRQNIKVGMPL